MENTSIIKKIIHDEKSGGLILIFCTIISLILANSNFQEPYEHFWHIQVGILNIEEWINDGLMAIFFFMIGLELKKEMRIGEFSEPQNAILPMAAAIGGMIIPALFFYLFNSNTPTQSGIGIPMATDIAFALGVLSLLGKRIPVALKIFLMALAVVDDLGAIIVIAIFYTSDLSFTHLFIALGIYIVLLIMNRWRIYSVIPYLILGVIMWYFMLSSGIHATITGVLTAFVIPFYGKGESSPLLALLDKLHTPVNFIILPIFALANTAVTISTGWHSILGDPLALGIFTGLVLGKPIGIALGSLTVVLLNVAKLPFGIEWKHIISVGFLGGIGFTMSIFITLLAFDHIETINEAKIVVLLSSLIAGIIGYILLNTTFKNKKAKTETK